MSIIVFTGPTIASEQLQTILSADYRPPARQGDIYLATQQRPKVIAIIDGYFQNTPAIWHKEILYAMSIGIHVFGASSMGALRSAELAHFGMQGIGEVYQQYANEQLESDDEVAIVHAPAELNYQNLSDALVNIRATFKQAKQANIISQNQAQQLVTIAAKTWYPERNYQNIFDKANHLIDKKTLQNLSDYCQSYSVDIKQQDAIALLNHLKDNLAAFDAPKQVDYHFAYTDAWQNMVEQVEQQQFNQSNQIPINDIIAALKAQGKYQHYLQYAQARQFTLDQVKKHNAQTNDVQKRGALITLAKQLNCVSNNQVDFAKLTKWFDEQHLTPQQFDKLVQNQAQLFDVNQQYQSQQTEQALIDLLRLDSQLGQLMNVHTKTT